MLILLTYLLRLWYPSLVDAQHIAVLREDTILEQDATDAHLLRIFRTLLEAQLKALKRLEAGEAEPKRKSKGMSQIEMVHDILRRARAPLHITDIIERVEKLHGKRLDRESIVSALVKKVNRGDRSVRADKNVFGLKGGE